MDFPELSISKRDREYRKYSREQRESVVMAYLFDDMSTRSLDENVLGLDKNQTHGWQSFDILGHYGLTDDFKGLFKGMSPLQSLEMIPDDPQYNFLFDIIQGNVPYDGVFEDNDETGVVRLQLTKLRVNQNSFRKKILCAYNTKCCITGIGESKILVASHIKPWCMSTGTEKLDVNNGLCLNSLHDKTFDCGLMTIDSETLCVKYSEKIKNNVPADVYETFFGKYDGIKITKSPDVCEEKLCEYLDFHNREIFEKKPKYGTFNVEIMC